MVFFFKAGFDSTEESTHPKLKGNWTEFLEALIPLIDGAKSLQFHLWLKNRGSDKRLVRNKTTSSFLCSETIQKYDQFKLTKV